MELDYKILDNRFKLIEKIGEGGMGVVYSAIDLHESRPVAVKLLKSERTSTYIEDILRFKKEIEILCSLNHENIIKIFGAGEYKSEPYIIMEHLRGDTLSALFEKGHVFTASEAICVIKQVSSALQYVHSFSILHRDIKPRNVFICKNEDKTTVKLLDFGISHLMELSHIKDEADILGTFGYISPEACGILNSIVDERSDLYSVGVILYQLITGQMPFKNKSVATLLHHQVAYIPGRPIVLNPLISETLDEIIMKLLNKDPDLRYQSAKGILHDIERLESGEKNFTIGVTDQKVKLLYNTKLIGRESELQKIKSLFEASCKGDGSFLLISGEAGIGKTKLLETFKEYAHSKKAIFLRGRCLNQHSKIPYQLFKDAMDEFISVWDTLDNKTSLDILSRLNMRLGSLLSIVEKLNPRMEQIIGSKKEIQPLEPERENQRFFNVISEFICWIGRNSKPLVLLFEDLHWVDEGSLLILKAILQKIKASNLLIIATYRNDEISENHGIHKIKQEFFKESASCGEIYLSQMRLSEIKKLISSIICCNDISEMLAEFVYNKSAGNPLFAIQMLRDMVESNFIAWNDDKWQENWNKIRNLYISNNVIDIILKRSEKLTPDQLILASTAAVIGKEFSVELLFNLFDFSKEKMINLLDEIIELNLMNKNLKKGRISFTHDKIRDAFYQKVCTQERCELHRKIAKILEADFLKSNEVVFDLAHHYIECQDLDKALQYLLPAANFARETFAYESSIRFYTIAINMLEEKNLSGEKEWLSAYENLSEIYITLGNSPQAIEGLNKILDYADDNISKARILKKLGDAYFKIGDWGKAEELVSVGLDILGEKIALNPLSLIFKFLKEYVLHLILLKTFNVSKLSKNPPFCGKDKEIYKEILSLYNSLVHIFVFKRVDLKYFYLFIRRLNISIKNRLGIVEIGEAVSAYSFMLSFIPFNKRSSKFFDLSAKIFHEANDEWRYFWNMRNKGFLYSWMGKREKSIACLQKAKTFFEKVGDIWELSLAYDGLAENYYFLGEYKNSLEIASKNLKIKQQTNEIYGICNAKTELALSYIDIGEHIKAETLLNDSLSLSLENKIWFIYCISLIYLGYLECERNNYEKAIDYLNDAMEVNEKNTFLKDYTVILYPRLAEAMVKRVMSIDSSVSLTKHQKRQIKGIINKSLKLCRAWPNQYGIILRIAACYSGLEGKWKLSEKLFKKSLKLLKQTGRKFEEAKALMDYAYILERKGNIAYPKECLLAAYRIFKSIGISSYAQKCAYLIGNHELLNTESIQSNKSSRLAWDMRMNTVLTTSRYLSSILDIDSLLEKILDSTLELLGAQRGLLFLYSSEEPKCLEIKAVRNFSEYEVKNRIFDISSSILKRMETETSPIIIHDAISDESFKKQYSIIQNKIRSVLCSPIIAHGEISGLIYLDNNLVGGLFNEDDIKILDIISNQAGVSIENARLYNKLMISSKEIEASRNEISQLNKELELRVSERTKQLQSLNDELAFMNKQLKQYADTIEEFSVIRERNRMAKDVHDTIGHSMTLLLTLLEVCKISCTTDIDKTIQRLEEASEIARVSLSKIRRSISGLLPEELEESDLISAIESLIDNFKYTGVKFNFSVDRMNIKIPSKYSAIIFRACQESITNAIRHGEPTEINIVLKLVGYKIKLFIIDNGNGCKQINEGVGLKGMRQRLESIEGTLKYGSDGCQGFHIYVEIPFEN